MKIITFKKLFLVLSCSWLVVFAASEANWFRTQTADAKISEITSLTLQAQYGDAANQAAKLIKLYPAHPGGCVLGAMNTLAHYDDLGNPNLLQTAKNQLEKCGENLREQASAKSAQQSLSEDEILFWQGLIHFQTGYVATQLGENLEGALEMRKGAGLLQDASQYHDSQAFYAIYGYYIDQLTKGLSWIPWLNDTRDQHISTIEEAARHSPYFSPLFATTLTWIHYDRKHYNKALEFVKLLRQKNPSHRVFEQMEGDMWFRMGKLQKARDIYQTSLKRYTDVAPRSLRWYCAVGNLLRICQEQGDAKAVKHFQSLMNHPSWSNIRQYMPASLTKDLERRKLL